MVIVREPGLNGFEWGRTLNKVKLDQNTIENHQNFQGKSDALKEVSPYSKPAGPLHVYV